MAKLQMQVEIERLPLKAPFRISGYTFTEVPVVVSPMERHLSVLVLSGSPPPPVR